MNNKLRLIFSFIIVIVVGFSVCYLNNYLKNIFNEYKNNPRNEVIELSIGDNTYQIIGQEMKLINP